MKRISFLILLSVSLSAQAQFFQPVQSSADPKTIIFPQNPVEIDVLCISKKSQAYDPVFNKTAPVKEGFSDLVFIPDQRNPTTEGVILLSHNINKINNDFRNGQNPSAADGGGVTQMKVRRKTDGHWEVLEMTSGGVKHKYKNISFSHVGGAVNLSGFLKYQPVDLNKPYKVYISEEAPFNSNKELFAKSTTTGNATGFRDTTDYTIPSNQNIASGKLVKKFENMGWMIELDPSQGKSLRKHYTVGRFPHSDATQMNSSILMISNTKPSLLFTLGANAFSANSNLDSLNQDCDLSVYYYNKKTDSYGWKSLNMPVNPADPEMGSYQDFELLKKVFRQALDSGAVMFSNLQKIGYDINSNAENIYLTENGLESSDDFFSDPAKKSNGFLPPHLAMLDEKDGNKDGKFSDPYGRILKMNVSNQQISVFMEGGQSYGDLFFSNPYDVFPTLSYTPDDDLGFREEFVMVIQEKITGTDKGRNPENISDLKDAINEVVWMKYDRESEKGKISDMNRFMIAPKGSAITGGDLVVDQFDFINSFTYFTVINTPVINPSTDSAFYNSMVIAVNLNAEDHADPWVKSTTGIEEYLATHPVRLDNITLWPNPASQTIYFSKKTDITVLDMNGRVVMTGNETDTMDISILEQGMYFIRTGDNEVVKVVIQ